jgi:hypothetical protein
MILHAQGKLESLLQAYDAGAAPHRDVEMRSL